MRPSVLIVDDHRRFRASAQLLLESEGFAVVGEAADDEGALQQARSLCPGLVLLDIQLPDCDGFEIADELGVRGVSAGSGGSSLASSRAIVRRLIPSRLARSR
ncbi:MAG: response regulator [Acidimicrobiales bacterium]